ncbi:MAG: tRNA guanosine(34) transglycosylase Tgt [Defluviitaleaceae bacterium]|nr:tRNA guanosine(34) transglycosylase Tgt [Defluviitaleaceae bacterium]MCL2262462.1 tRNA guanosine(34) transglycosylase Tgt [Defluviitaleaceae bacterium]
MYTVKATDGRAKRAALQTPHGIIETPVFMNVATAAAIKGALSAVDLKNAGCEVALCNTYHLHLRPGEGVVRDMGGLQKFMVWDRPILTDSGGFQVFSLGALRKIREEGVYFSSHIDGRKIFMGPEESMEIQSALGATIAMAFDECPPFPATREYMNDSVARTTRWLSRSAAKMQELNKTAAHKQLLFGINQGGIYPDIRKQHAKEISEMNLDGYALGGLAVGEPAEDMYNILEETVPHLPQNKPTYLMGVGTPQNLLEAIERGVDFFDCVMPARNGRHGHVFTSQGKLNLFNARHERDDSPIDPACNCEVCRTFSRAYIRHLFKAKEMLALRLAVMHNLYFYNALMREARAAIEANNFATFKRGKLECFR